MSKRKNFSSSQRWSIWTIYGMKCFKCNKPVDFDQCEIGRVIPESVSKIVVSSLAKDYQLPADFSVNDYSNFVPTCRACNKGKAATVFRPAPAMQSWFDQIRIKAPMVEAKVRLIEGDPSSESFLKSLVAKLERGEISREDVEGTLKPFLDAVESKPKAAVEFRLSNLARVFFSEEGLRMQPVSEIRYEKFVDGIVESGDWKRKRAAEVIREGPTFGEGGSRRPMGGA